MGEGHQGVEVIDVETGRTTARLRVTGRGEETVVFVHGNVASSRFFEETLGRLPQGVGGMAPDLRGFGGSESAPVDARRGLRDFSDDLAAIIDCYLEAKDKVHLVGWSLGGGVVMQYAIDHPERVASVLLEASMPPRGVGGTFGPEAEPCTPDFAGSGAGLVNREFLERLQAGDAGEDSELSPRVVMRRTFFAPGFSLGQELEDAFTAELLDCVVGADNYPGDFEPSPNWPGVAPGERGVNNAISSRHCDLSAFARAALSAPVVWLRGLEDVIVSDSSPLDPAVLGREGRLPGWPGSSYPPQPMLRQLRRLLEERESLGGEVAEVALGGCGHSPHLEHPEDFDQLLAGLVARSRAVS